MVTCGCIIIVQYCEQEGLWWNALLPTSDECCEHIEKYNDTGGDKKQDHSQYYSQDIAGARSLTKPFCQVVVAGFLVSASLK